jgi:peptidoglycan/xylan/chitin deacetylase (PgdA/CDA1 family)
MLRDEGVLVTFFVLGESLERYGYVLDTYRDCGHVIGLHGDRHYSFTSPSTLPMSCVTQALICRRGGIALLYDYAPAYGPRAASPPPASRLRIAPALRYIMPFAALVATTPI